MTAATAQSLNTLAARLTRPEDRETYAGLISYFESLPEHDELFHIVELLGLLTLLGQQLPDSLATAMAQMRQLTDKAGEYYGEIDTRLEGLPAEITAGVDVAAIGRAMGEAFRQCISESGLEASTMHLRATAAEMAALTTTLKPVTQQYTSLADSIASGVNKLMAASARLEGRLVQPAAAPQQAGDRLMHGLLMVVMLLIGVVAGRSWDKFIR